MKPESFKESATWLAALRQWVIRRVPWPVLAVLVFALALAALTAGIAWLVAHEDAAPAVGTTPAAQETQKQERLQERKHHE